MKKRSSGDDWLFSCRQPEATRRRLNSDALWLFCCAPMISTLGWFDLESARHKSTANRNTGQITKNFFAALAVSVSFPALFGEGGSEKARLHNNSADHQQSAVSLYGMAETSPQSITQLLLAWSNGDQAALEQLVPQVYQELRRQAEFYLRQERPGHLLQPTALVNEAYLRLIDCDNIQWQNRAQFFAVAAQLMRRILVDFARARDYAKRGGGLQQVSLADAAIAPHQKVADLVALDDALNTLAELDPRQSRVVELRFFGGLNLEEIAEVLKVSVGTVRRDWSLAQAWLFNELKHDT
jgi:RNA polymerase sigma factor (TIGR02999 family)